MKSSTASFIPARLATLAMLGAVLLGAGSASATTYYWDTDGDTPGFGNTAGTWGTSNFWTSTEGGGSPHSEVTATLVDDTVNFGSASLALGATAANVGVVAGGVTVNSITFGLNQGATAITLGTAGKTITLGGTTPTITVNNASDTISSVLAGTSLDKAGTGVLILTGTNTYSGTTTINAGKLQIGNNGTTGTLGSGSVLNNDRLSFFRTDLTTFNSTMTGTGTLEVVKGTLRLASGANVTQANLSGSTGGNAGLEVQSGASLTVSNKFLLGISGGSSGTVAQSGGTVNLNSTVAGDIQITPTFNSHSKYNLSGGTLNATGTAMIVGAWFEGTLDVSGGTANLRGIQFCTGSGTRAAYLNLSGTGILNIGVGGITDGSTSANTMTMNFSGGTLGALANWTTSGNQMNNQKITLSNTNTIDTTGGNITLTPVLTGTGGITKAGTGTLTFSGTNTYTGVTTITAGTLALGTNNALPSASALSIGSATLNTATYTNTLGTLDITGSAVITLGTGGKLAFADSSAKTWSGGTLTLTGVFVNSSSVRFGTSASGLTPTQKEKITFNGMRMTLDSNGYVVVFVPVGTLVSFF